MKKTLVYDCDCKRKGSKKVLASNHCLLCLIKVIGDRMEKEISK